MLLLTAFLWLAGGVNWVAAHEAAVRRTLNPFGRVLFIAIWPAVTALIMLTELHDAVVGPAEE